MKSLLSFLVILAMVSPLYGDTLLFQENFDGAAATAVSGWNGWGGGTEVKISSAVIDQGNSASWSGITDWPTIAKAFTHTPTAGESYVLSATMLAPTADAGSYADLRIRNWAGGEFLQIAIGYNDLLFGNGTNQVEASQPTTATDVKMVITDTSLTGYYRANGTTPWTSAGTLALGAGYALSGYNTMMLVAEATGGIDSIQLTATPEPTALVLMITGLLGLLAYAWRKRK